MYLTRNIWNRCLATPAVATQRRKMSYRDLRNFTEMMRSLGYSRMISMENFREPNFALVAEVLKWLVNRYDPHAEIPSDTDTPEDRVIFIKAVAQFMASKAHIKLNPKKLYSADGYAVKELLKVSSLLYTAMKASDHTQEEPTAYVEAGLTPMEINAKVTELKKCRQLASEITSKGAKLYDLLSREVDLKTKREEALSKAIDIDEIDQGLKRSMEAVNDEIQRMKRRLENSASDEANLEAKIEKKKQELERNKKRLKSLQTVKPAYMDEYEKIEKELHKQYEVYVEKFKNLHFLEQQLSDLNRSEQDRIEETENHLRRMQLRMREDERKMMEDNMVPYPDLTSGVVEGTGDREPRVYGTMIGNGDSEDDSLSSGSNDEGLDDQDDRGDLMDDDEDDEDDINGDLQHGDSSGDDF